MNSRLQLAVPGHASAPYEDPSAVGPEFQSRARREGTEFDAIAMEYLEQAGARVLRGRHERNHYPVDAEVQALTGAHYLVLAHGNVGDSSPRPGLQRTDTLAKVVTRVVGLHLYDDLPVIVVTSHLPRPGSTCAHQLADLRRVVRDDLAEVVATSADMAGFQRLCRRLCGGALPPRLRVAPWEGSSHTLTLFDSLLIGGGPGA